MKIEHCQDCGTEIPKTKYSKKEKAIGAELSVEQAKEEMESGRILTTLDGMERAILYKGRFATWQTTGKLIYVLNFLVDFTGWYVMER